MSMFYDADLLLKKNEELFKDDVDGSAKKHFIEFMDVVAMYIKRDGINTLLSELLTTDFFIAPASTRYHGCKIGGLCEHSLTVFYELERLRGCYFFDFSMESCAIVALFHDLCKIGMYKKTQKWKKEDGQWVSYDAYTCEEDFPFGGHGSKSVFIVSSYMKLTEEEATAINTHMGCWDGNTLVSKSYEKYPLAWALHIADEASTFIRRI